MTFDPKEARALVAQLDGYTPGPWRVDNDGDVIARLGYMIADLLVLDGNQTAEDEANAHLIAAAPVLHSRLTAALDEIERLRDAYTGAMEDKRKWKGRCAKAEAEIRALKGADQ